MKESRSSWPSNIFVPPDKGGGMGIDMGDRAGQSLLMIKECLQSARISGQTYVKAMSYFLLCLLFLFKPYIAYASEIQAPMARRAAGFAVCRPAAGYLVARMQGRMGDKQSLDDSLAGMPGADGWEDIDRFLQQESAGMEITVTFTDLMKELLDKDAKGAGRAVLDLLKQSLVREVSRGGHLAGQILAVGLVGAVFAGFSSVFSSSQISETGSYLTYLLAFSALAAAFLDSIGIAGEVLQRQMEFMRVLVPSYFLAVAWAGSVSSSAAWMELVLVLIAAIEWLYLNLLLPMTKVYLLLVLVGNMTKEDMLSRMIGLLQTGIRWGTRSLFGVVLGFQLLQGMVLPYADAVKVSGLQKVLQVIPGIGNGAGAAAKMLLGSGVLIKNTMGAAAVAVLAVITLVPVLKLGILMGIYHMAAAVLQPVGDKRLVGCVAAVADGQRTLVGMVVSGLLLFVITIALVCAGSNVAYLA